MQPTRETPQPQPPFRRPLRPGFDTGNRRPAPPPTEKRWPWNRLPTSMIINFAALLALFGIVYALQNVGDRFGASNAENTPAATSTSVAELPAIPAAESAPTPTTVTAPAADLAAPVPSPDTAAAAAPQQVYTLPQPPAAPAAVAPTPPAAVPTTAPSVTAAPAPAEEQPRIDAGKTATAKRKAVAEQRQRQAWNEDREVTVDALDNESARRHYLSANKGGTSSSPQDVAPARSRPQPLPAATLPRAGEERASTAGDLDGEGARQRYLTENRRTSQGGVEERTERRAATPRPDTNEYIPYEQGR